MPRNVEFDRLPEPFSILVRGDLATVSLTENIRAEEKEDGGEGYFADLYFIAVPYTENLSERIALNTTKYLEAAKLAERISEKEATDTITQSDIMEIVAEQEYRICLLELGIGGMLE